MFRAVVLGCLLATSLAFDAFLNTEWEAYKTTYGKVYEAEVEGIRFILFYLSYFKSVSKNYVLIWLQQ